MGLYAQIAKEFGSVVRPLSQHGCHPAECEDDDGSSVQVSED
jgi:hypothetical protein